MDGLFNGISLICLGGIIILFIKDKYKGVILSTLFGIGMVFILISNFNLFMNKIPYNLLIDLPFPVGSLNIVFDPLSSFFVSIITVGGFLVVLYSTGYVRHYIIKKNKIYNFYFFLIILTVSMLLLVIVQNAIFFLILWELMSLSSFFLVTFEKEKEEVIKSGIYYLVAMHIGLIFLIIGFVILSVKTNSYDFNIFSIYLKNSSTAFNSFIFILFFIGFGTKAGFVPFHTWLPQAHPAAPTPVSGIMSGVMIKTGIYGILRILLISAYPSKCISYIILFISIFTCIFGILNAIAQQDLKRLLAYSSIENIGIVGLGIGIGMLGLAYNNQFMAILGFSGGILHVLNHFIFKSLLFFGAGAVYTQIHTRDIESMGGLIKKMPVTSILFLIGSIAIIGLPPFNGFISEFIIYSGILKGIINKGVFISILSIISFASLAYTGVLALFCFSKIFSVCFLGNPRSKYLDKIKEESLYMIIPMIILAGFIIIIGFYPQLFLPFINMITGLFINSDIPYQIQLNNYLYNISASVFIFLGIFVFIFFIRFMILKNKKISLNETWGCGYQMYNSRMQYTSSSFASILLNIFAPFINYKIKNNINETLFPEEKNYKSHSADIFERFIINPILNGVKKILNIFSWIQSGNTQLYILYGIIFLVAVIIYLIGVK